MIKTWLIYALLSAFFAALTAIFAKAGLKHVNADLATAVRTSVILVIVWGIVFFRQLEKGIVNLNANNWLFLVLSAVATGLSWIFYYRALQLGKAAEVTVVDKSSILFTILLACLFLKEPLTPRILLAAALIFGGLMVMIWK